MNRIAMPPLERFFFFIGRMLFPRQQDWQQTRSAKTLVVVVLFSVALAFTVAKIIRIVYNHKK